MRRSVFAIMFGQWFPVAAVFVIAVGLARPCAASESTRLAAESYDAALAHFERAEYADAAKRFLEADELHPSEEALSNAIATARRANEHLLVARAALRAQAREETAPELAARARQALAEAEVHLSRVDLSCVPLPCELTLDGKSLLPGRHYVLPGSHRVSAQNHEQSTSQNLLTNAGATYRLRLEVVAEPSPDDESHQAPPRTNVASSMAFTPEPKPAEATQAALPVEVFYGSLALTGVVTGVTVWSGLQALKQKRNLEHPPSEASRNELVASVRRTDILLATSALLALTTTYVGWKLVDFGAGAVRAQAVPGQYSLTASGRF